MKRSFLISSVSSSYHRLRPPPPPPPPRPPFRRRVVASCRPESRGYRLYSSTRNGGFCGGHRAQLGDDIRPRTRARSIRGRLVQLLLNVCHCLKRPFASRSIETNLHFRDRRHSLPSPPTFFRFVSKVLELADLFATARIEFSRSTLGHLY